MVEFRYFVNKKYYMQLIFSSKSLVTMTFSNDTMDEVFITSLLAVRPLTRRSRVKPGNLSGGQQTVVS
jgi:hypothetical protein